MSNVMVCNFYDIFGLTSDDKYKLRVSLQDKDIYYPKNTIFNYDSKIFDGFICFYEGRELILEVIEERKLDNIFKFKIKTDSKKNYSRFINADKEKNLFRFAEKKWIKKAYLEGNFRIKPSIDYIRNEYNEARQDNEHLLAIKMGNSFMNYSDKVIPVENVTKFFIDTNINKYILCMSYEYDERLFDEFKAKNEDKNCMLCLVITDTHEFERRLTKAVESYDMIGARVSYSEIPNNLGIIFNKSRKFKIQKEFRFLFYNLDTSILCNDDDITNKEKEVLDKLSYKFIDINLGSLEDIAFVVNNEGEKINFL